MLCDVSQYRCHTVDDEIDTGNGNAVAQCFVPTRVGSIRDIRLVIREPLEPFTLQRGQAADQIDTFDDALVLAYILVIDPLVVGKAEGTHGLLVWLHHQVSGILVLTCAFGADYIVLLEHI